MFYILALLKMNGILTNEQVQSVEAGDKPKGSLNNRKHFILCTKLCVFLCTVDFTRKKQLFFGILHEQVDIFSGWNFMQNVHGFW